MTEKKKKTLESISRARNGDQTWKIKAERIIGKTTFLCTMLFAIWIHGEQVFAAEENGTRDTCLRCGVSQEAYLVTRCPRQIRHGRLLLRLCFSIPSYIRCIVLLRVISPRNARAFLSLDFNSFSTRLDEKKPPSSPFVTMNTIQLTWKSIFFYFI